MSRRRGVWLIAPLLCLALVGCGSTSKSTPTATPKPSAASAGANCWPAGKKHTIPFKEDNGTVKNIQQWSEPPQMTLEKDKTYSATIQTNKGTIDVTFYPDDAPQTVNNFVCLAEAGYYDNTPIHRIVKGFVIQGGDPTGTGTGGPGYQFNDEPVKRDYLPGTLAMANAGPNTNGSQFFIVLSNLSGQLPKNYTIFGQVSGGMDVVNAIANTPTKSSGPPMNEQSVPTQPVTIEKVTINSQAK